MLAYKKPTSLREQRFIERKVYLVNRNINILLHIQLPRVIQFLANGVEAVEAYTQRRNTSIVIIIE